jgi:hypothetical protein
MTHGVDGAAHSMKAPGPHPTGDAVAVDASRDQLGERDHSMLPRRYLGDHGVRPALGRFLSHFDEETAHSQDVPPTQPIRGLGRADP